MLKTSCSLSGLYRGRWQGCDLCAPVTMASPHSGSVSQKNWAKTEGKQWASPSLSSVAKTGGWGGIKPSNEAKNNLDRGDLATAARGRKEMWITRGLDVAMMIWSEAPCPQCPAVITCSTQLSFLSLWQLQYPVRAQDTVVYICNADLRSRGMNNFLFVRLFHFPSFTGSWSERAPPGEWRVNEAVPLSMTLTNRDLRGRGFGFNVSCPGVENLHSGSPTTSWELFSFWSADGHYRCGHDVTKTHCGVETTETLRGN